MHAEMQERATGLDSSITMRAMYVLTWSNSRKSVNKDQSYKRLEELF